MVAKRQTLSITATIQDRVTKPLQRVGRSLADFGKRFGRAFAGLTRSVVSLKTALLGVGLAFATGQLAAMVKETTAANDAMLKLARSTNTTVEEISKLGFAFQSAGVGGASELRTIITALERQRNAALRGDPNQAGAFAALGVSIQDLESLGSTEVFRKLAAGIEAYGDRTRATTQLQVIFTENFRRLLNLIGQGAGAYDELIRQGQRYGVVTERSALISEKLQDAFLRLEGAFTQIKNAFLENVGEPLTKAIQSLADTLVKNKDTIVGALKLIVLALADVGKFVFRVATGFQFFFSVGQDKVDALASRLNTLTAGLNTLLQNQLPADRSTPENVRLFGVFESSVRATEVFQSATEAQQREILAQVAYINSVAAQFRQANDETVKARQSILDLRKNLDSIAEGLFKDLDGAERNPLTPPGGGPDGGDGGGGGGRPPGFIKGFLDGFKALREQLNNLQVQGKRVAQQVGAAFQNNLATTLDRLSAGTLKVKNAFKELATSILADLRRISSRILSDRFLGALLNAIGGAVTPSTGPGASANVGGQTVNRFSNGKVSNPFALGASIAGNPAAGGQVVNNYYIYAVDAQSFQQLAISNKTFLAELVAQQTSYNQGLRDAVGRS